MKKRTITIVISVLIILAVTVTAYAIWKGKKNTGINGQWIEKTINKEIMKTDADCGVVSVKMLLGFYGMDLSYKELENKINISSEGTDWEDIKIYFNTLDKFNFLEYEKNIDKAKEYLEKGYPLLINWNVDEDEDYSHYSILISIDKNSVWMLDPAEKKSLSEYSSDYFLPCWKSADYWFCVIEEKDKENRNPEQIADEETNVKSIDEVNWEISDTLEETFSLLDTTGTDGK